jgi:hypothetical protein
LSEGRKKLLFSKQTIPSLFIILLGSLDCLTTVIGTLFFGTSELNPILASLVNSNLAAFIVVKLTVTFSVGLIFILANKTLLKLPEKATKAFETTNSILRFGGLSIIILIAIVLVNNILILLRVAL